MRIALIGLAVFAGALVVGWSLSSPDPAWADPPKATASPVGQGSAGTVIALSHSLDNGDLQVVLVDAEKKVMSVYVVARGNGAITLKSVRNVQWDLLMEQYNGTKPLPQEIRSLLERR